MTNNSNTNQATSSTNNAQAQDLVSKILNSTTTWSALKTGVTTGVKGSAMMLEATSRVQVLGVVIVRSAEKAVSDSLNLQGNNLEEIVANGATKIKGWFN